MSDRLQKLCSVAYPRAWRDRYEDELSELCAEMLEQKETSKWRLGVGIVASGAIERIHTLGRSPRRLAVASGAATVVLAGVLAMVVGGDSLSYPVGRQSAAIVRVERCSHVPPVPLGTDVVIVFDPRAAGSQP